MREEKDQRQQRKTLVYSLISLLLGYLLIWEGGSWLFSKGGFIYVTPYFAVLTAIFANLDYDKIIVTAKKVAGKLFSWNEIKI